MAPIPRIRRLSSAERVPGPAGGGGTNFKNGDVSDFPLRPSASSADNFPKEAESAGGEGNAACRV